MVDCNKTYWASEGKHQVFQEALATLVPIEGSVKEPKKNPKLEKFRKASNCYYDLYNNGLGNRAREFYGVFGIASSHYRIGGPYDHSQHMYDMVEAKMDQIIMEAMEEQTARLFSK